MDRNTTVGFAVAILPQAIPYFESCGIDFCCGGNRNLSEVLKEKGLDENEVFGYLEKLHDDLVKSGKNKNFLDMPSDELCDYIVASHHAYLREKMPVISQYLDAVMRAHGEKHPELFELTKLFGALRGDLDQHLLREEMFLFPAIKKKEKGENSNPEEYIHEHENAGELLAKLEHLTSHYSPPSDACETYVALYQMMHEMEEDLHRHIHLENNILFLR